MSLIVTLPAEKTINLKGKTITTSQLEVLKMVDIPSKKTIVVLIKGLGKVRVKGLSRDAYNNPEWTDETLKQAIIAQFT